MSLDRFRSVDIRIDKADHYFMSSQFAKGGDYNGRTLIVQITNGGLIETQAGVTVNLGWYHESVKNSGLEPFEVVDVAQGIFEVSYPREMLNPGRVTAVIQIIDGEIITETKNFVIQVEKSPIDETTIVSSNVFTVLQEALISVNGWNARIDAVEADFIQRAVDMEAAYPQQIISLGQQLEQNAAKIRGVSIPENYTGPVLTFIDDDAKLEFKTIWQPIFDAKGIKINIGVISDAVGDAGYMTLGDLTVLSNQGHEVMSHTKNHVDLSGLTEAQLIAQLNDSKQFVLDNGFYADSVVYPFGGATITQNVKDITRRYYDYAFDAAGTYNDTPIDNMLVKRYFGFDTGTLDQTIAANGWLVIYTHSHTLTPENVTSINALIDYAVANNVPILTVSEAIKYKGNVIAAGEYTNTDSFFVAKDGHAKYNNQTNLKAKIVGASVWDKAITDYPLDTQTFELVQDFNATGINCPTPGKGGVLITTRTISGQDVFSYQTYQLASNNDIYKRKIGSAWGKITPDDSNYWGRLAFLAGDCTNVTSLTFNTSNQSAAYKSFDGIVQYIAKFNFVVTSTTAPITIPLPIAASSMYAFLNNAPVGTPVEYYTYNSGDTYQTLPTKMSGNQLTILPPPGGWSAGTLGSSNVILVNINYAKQSTYLGDA